MAYRTPLELYKRSPIPALPESRDRWLEEELRKLERTLENYHERLDRKYGAFQDTTTQTAAAINTPYAIKLNTTDFQYGPKLDTVDTSKIKIDQDGIYNFEFSIQLYKNSGNLGYVWVWPRVNGVDIPMSTTKINLQGSAAAEVAAWNFMLDMKSGDYFQLMWATNDTGCRLLYEAATAFCPSIPSVILTVTEVV